MNKLIIDYFNQKRHDASMSLVREAQPGFMLESEFPYVQTGSLKWDAINAKVTNIAAPVQAFDTASQIAKRDDMEVATGKINPIQMSYKLNEEYMYHLNNPDYQNMILRELHNDSQNAFNAVKARLKFIRMQQLSTGTVTYSVDNNAGGISGAFVDYNLDSWQTDDVATSWATSASATPIADIHDAVETLNGQGRYPEVIRMTKATFNQMIACDEVTSTFNLRVTNGNIANNYIGLGEFNVFLSAKGLPEIQIVRDEISYMKEDGTFDNTRRAWGEGKVQFGYLREGETKWVEPLEYKNRSLTSALTTLTEGIVVQKYSELDPPSVITKAKGVMFPVWTKAKDSFILDVTP